jgi:hypothetical protein
LKNSKDLGLLINVLEMPKPKRNILVLNFLNSIFGDYKYFQKIKKEYPGIDLLNVFKNLKCIKHSNTKLCLSCFSISFAFL